VPYPDRLLADDEEVVAHLHPHWTTLFWPVVRLLAVVGAASHLAALVPAGPQQGVLRLALLAVALVVLAATVVRPVLRWRTTHVVVTTHRVLVREGVLSRRGRDVGLSRITDVSYEQTPWERIVRSGTITVDSVGDGGPLVLRRVPHCDGLQALLVQLAEDDGPPGRRPGHRGPAHRPRALRAGAATRCDRSVTASLAGSVGPATYLPHPCGCCTPPTGTSGGPSTGRTCSPSRRRCCPGWPAS
jgi:membrane protein YdbS with pleckstrin-like domain